MNIRTISLAIRVVKNTLSDTRFKVTGQRPGRGRCSGHLWGTQREARQVAFAHLLCGWGLPARGPLMGNLASWVARSRGRGERPTGAAVLLLRHLLSSGEGAQTPPWAEGRLSES